MARFLENHDEPRAAAPFPPDTHRAAAILAFLTPGLRFIHQGQREGARVRIPVHLARGPLEAPDRDVIDFYDGLLDWLKNAAVGEGEWSLGDQMGTAVYDRDCSALAQQGLYLDMPAWGYHVFAVSAVEVTYSVR